MTTNILIEEQKQQLLKALAHLEYSYNKLQSDNGRLDLEDKECPNVLALKAKLKAFTP